MSEPATKDFLYGLLWGIAIMGRVALSMLWIIVP